LFKRGNTKARLNDLQGALADYNETLRVDPKSADAYFNRGVVFYKLGDQRTALADLQQAQGLYSAAGDQGGAQRSASAAREVQSTPPPPRR
jgi:tetratricopeptide (TPR) repeat protein